MNEQIIKIDVTSMKGQLLSLTLGNDGNIIFNKTKLKESALPVKQIIALVKTLMTDKL